MQAIEIDDDVYEYLRRQQTSFSGESASEILRRLFKLNPPLSSQTANGHGKSHLNEMIAAHPEQVKEWIAAHEKSLDAKSKPLWNFVRGPQFKGERNAVGRFLAILAFAHSENRNAFFSVVGINGRSRKYFAKSKAELEQSGVSVNPKKIPGSDYWVVTNNSTQSKIELVLDVLKVLGYDGGMVPFAAMMINHKN